MTLKQLEKTRNLLSKIDFIKGMVEMQEFASELKSFYGVDFTIKLKITTWNTIDTYSQVYEKNDKIAIRNFLESLIAQDENASVLNGILDLIAEGQKVKGDESLREKYVSKVYYSYSGNISFDEMTKAIATAPQEMWNMNMYQASEEMIDGIIAKLRSYAETIFQKREPALFSTNSNPTVVVNNIATATNNVNIDILLEIESAINQVKEACLPDVQEKEVLAKIQELQEILESNESKRKRWTKIKDIFKWVAEQGIQVASIIVPLLATTIQ